MTLSNTAEQNELAAETMERLREALSGERMPSIARIIEIVRRMSDKADVLSIQDLAEAIGHDVTTMVKVMKAANCLHFNPTALEVGTIARAVSVIGFNKIQHLALSLMLLDGAENRANSTDSREASSSALCGGLIAEEILRRFSQPDPDEAFVAATLRGYGRLLLSVFAPEEFQEATELARQLPAERAFRLIFGLTPLEVSRRILEDVNLSGVPSAVLQPLSPSLLRLKHPGREETLLLALDLAAAFTDLVSRPENTSKDCERLTEQLLDKYRQALPIDGDAFKEVLEAVHSRLDGFGRAQGIEVFGGCLMRRIRAMAEGKNFEVETATKKAGARAVPASEEAVRSRGLLALAIKRIRQLLNASSVEARDRDGAEDGAGDGVGDGTPPDVREIAASAIRTAMRLESCIVFGMSEDGVRFSARAGDGALFRRIAHQPLIEPSRRDVFTLCLAKGDDVLIQDPLEPRISPFVPAWFQDALDGGPFLLLPIKDSAGVLAVICGVARRGQRVDLGVTRVSQFRTLRQLLGELRGKPHFGL